MIIKTKKVINKYLEEAYEIIGFDGFPQIYELPRTLMNPIIYTIAPAAYASLGESLYLNGKIIKVGTVLNRTEMSKVIAAMKFTKKYLERKKELSEKWNGEKEWTVD